MYPIWLLSVTGMADVIYQITARKRAGEQGERRREREIAVLACEPAWPGEQSYRPAWLLRSSTMNTCAGWGLTPLASGSWARTISPSENENFRVP